MHCRQDSTPRHQTSRPTSRPLRPPPGPAPTLLPNDTPTPATSPTTTATTSDTNSNNSNNNNLAQRGSNSSTSSSTSSNGHAAAASSTPTSAPSNALVVSHCNHHTHTVVCHIEGAPAGSQHQPASSSSPSSPAYPPFDDSNDPRSAALSATPVPTSASTTTTTTTTNGLQLSHPTSAPSSEAAATATATATAPPAAVATATGAEPRRGQGVGVSGSDVLVVAGSAQANGGGSDATATATAGPGHRRRRGGGSPALPSPTVVVSAAAGDSPAGKAEGGGDGVEGGGGGGGGAGTGGRSLGGGWGFLAAAEGKRGGAGAGAGTGAGAGSDAGYGGPVTGEVQRAEEGGSKEKRHSHQSVASNDSVSSEASSVTKRARRLAKKVPSMSPGAKWRRLRNTLKAAHEMQAPKKKQALSREDSFLRKFSTRNQRLHSQFYSSNEDGGYNGSNTGGSVPRNTNEPRSFKPPRNFAVQHDGNFMFKWLGVVTVAVLYNLWTCILRQAFREVQTSCHACWITFDVLVDIVYLLDILVQFRTGYLNQGLMVYDSRKLAHRYIQSRLLYVDALCLLPLDFLQLSPYIGVYPIIRFPRFIKVYRTFRFIHMLESRTAYPNLIRVANLTHILFLGAHWFAAFYYMISEAEDFKGKWSYPEPDGEYAFVSRKYLASLFWSTLTLTTIGDLPPPENGKEYVFVIMSYLIGVFVFATIVGQVGNVINNKNASRQEFERLLDGAKVYMQTHNVPSDLQKRVQRWYDYVWSRGRLNGCDINSLGLLPDKLKTELAIHVNLETLKKVTIFQECQPEFLHDLVLKMKAYIFTPGDLICRRGEVAREMFIIADGVVEIISESGTVLKQMGAGDFFGEIGILNLDGGINRRTADVRSVGYSELFVLSRDDVLAALKDHPDAESIIRDYGQRRLREIEAHRQLVKPLKQLGAANRRILSLRGMGSGAGVNVTSASGSAGAAAGGGGGGSVAGGGGGGGGPAGGGVAAGGGGGGGGGNPAGLHTQARAGSGGRTYTYCYANDDPESHLAFSGTDRSFLSSVCSNVRRIFHRKVRRQKSGKEDPGTDAGGSGSGTTGDAAKAEGKLAWMPEEQQRGGGSGGGRGRMVKLCCSTGGGGGGSGGGDARGRRDDYTITVSAASLHSRAGSGRGGEVGGGAKRFGRGFGHAHAPSGYTAVLTEEDENSRCPSPTSPVRSLPQANAVAIDGHNHRLPDVTAQAAASTTAAVVAGKTVAEVTNSAGAGDDDDDDGDGDGLLPDSRLTSTGVLPEIHFSSDEGVAAAEEVVAALRRDSGNYAAAPPCDDSDDGGIDGGERGDIDEEEEEEEEEGEDGGGGGGNGGKANVTAAGGNFLRMSKPRGGRRRSEPAPEQRSGTGDRRLSECSAKTSSSRRSSSAAHNPRRDRSLCSLDVACLGESLPRGAGRRGVAPSPLVPTSLCIRVESASTLDSLGSEDSSPGPFPNPRNLLHPEYLSQFDPAAGGFDGSDDDDDEDDDGERGAGGAKDGASFRCRSNSAPSIGARAYPGSSFDLPCDTAAARLSPAGSSVAVEGIAAPPAANRVSLFQRRLSTLAKLDGTKRNVPAPSLEILGSSRVAPWTPLKSPGSDQVSVDSHQVTALLVQLQASHAQLHSRMTELEAAYADNAARLDRLGAAQADMLALLTEQTQATGGKKSAGGRRFSWTKARDQTEDMTAL